MNKPQAVIDALKKTLETIDNQGVVSKSPCAKNGTSVIFCTGAIFVAEFINIVAGNNAKNDFYAKLVDNRENKDFIWQQSETFGLNSNAVKTVMHRNDAEEDISRKANMQNYVLELMNWPSRLLA